MAIHVYIRYITPLITLHRKISLFTTVTFERGIFVTTEVWDNCILSCIHLYPIHLAVSKKTGTKWKSFTNWNSPLKNMEQLPKKCRLIPFVIFVTVYWTCSTFGRSSSTTSGTFPQFAEEWSTFNTCSTFWGAVSHCGTVPQKVQLFHFVSVFLGTDRFSYLYI